jgi:hypothetical protein
MKLALFLHVLSAMVLVGTLVLAATSVAADNLRLGHRALLFGAIPSWIAMRVAAQWTFSEQGWDEVDPEPAWIGIGFATSESTFLLIVGATVCAWRAARRGRGDGLRIATLVLLGIVLLAYLVAIWAMTTKPT